MLTQSQDPVFSDPDLVLFVDTKGLYDATNSELATDDAASALEVPVIKEGLQRFGAGFVVLPTTVIRRTR